MFAFFYGVGVVFRVSGYSICIVVLIACLVRPAGSKYLVIGLHTLTFVFLAAATLVLFAYVEEVRVMLLSSNPYERHVFVRNRLLGPYFWAFWLQYFCAALPQLLWLSPFRRPLPLSLIAGVSLLPTVLAQSFTLFR